MAQAALVETLTRLREPAARLDIALLVQVPARFEASARASLPDFVTVQITEYADIWVRDCAPLYTTDQAWSPGFNGWGGLDPEYSLDFTGRDALNAHFGTVPATLPFIFEGGNLHTDGRGFGIYVASSVLTSTRNPGLTEDELDQYLSAKLGLQEVLALDCGLHSDETGGHVDNVLTFLDAQTLALSMTWEPSHPDYACCQRIYKQLQQSTAVTKRGLRIIELPLPHLQLSKGEAKAIVQPLQGFQRHAGMPLCASYCNGVRLGDYYLVPQFDCAEDNEVMEILRDTMPDLKLVAVPARALLVGGGGWHCASHTVP